MEDIEKTHIEITDKEIFIGDFENRKGVVIDTKTKKKTPLTMHEAHIEISEDGTGTVTFDKFTENFVDISEIPEIINTLIAKFYKEVKKW